MVSKGAWGVALCRTFISFISSFSQAAGSNLAHSPLRTLPKLYGIGCMGVVDCKRQKTAAVSTDSFLCNHSVKSVLIGFKSTRETNSVEVIPEYH